MYRYLQSPEFISGLDVYKTIIDDNSLNGFLKDLSNSPRKAKNAHSLHKPFSKYNIWAAHLRAKGGAFFTILYLLCDNGLNSCEKDDTNCKHFISKCHRPIQQLVFLEIEKGEPYEKLSSFYT